MVRLFEEQPDELAKRMILTVYGSDVKLPEFGFGVSWPDKSLAAQLEFDPVSYNSSTDKVVLPFGNPSTGTELEPRFGFLEGGQSPAERRHGQELIGSIFHLSPEQVTEEHSTVYIVAHELGHWRPYRDVPGSLQASILARNDFNGTTDPDSSARQIAYRQSSDEWLAAQNAAFVIQRMIQVHGDDAFPGLANGWQSPEHIAADGVPSLMYMVADDNYLWHAYAPDLVLPEIQALSAVIPDQGDEVPGSRMGRRGTEMDVLVKAVLRSPVADSHVSEPILDEVRGPLAEVMEKLSESDRQILTTVALADGKMPTLGIDLAEARPPVAFVNDFVYRLALDRTLDMEGVLDEQADSRWANRDLANFVQTHSDLYQVREPLTALAHARLSDEDEALASGQNLPQSAADERRRTMLEAYLDDVTLTETVKPKMSLTALHSWQADNAASRVKAGLDLGPLDEWALERDIPSESVIDEAWNGLSRHDRRLAMDAESPVLRYVHDVAGLARADPAWTLDDLGRGLEDKAPLAAMATPYDNWLLAQSLDRSVDDVPSSPPSSTTISLDAGDGVAWSDSHVGSVLDRSGQQQTWPGQLSELWQARHVTDALETGARSLDALDVVGLSPVVHRDAAMPDMSFVVMTVAVEDGVMPTLWGVPDVVGQPCKTLPLSAEPLEQDAGLALAALGDRMLMAKSGGLAGVAELTRVLDGLSVENLVDVAMAYPMTTKMPVLGGPFGRTFEDADAVTVVAGAAGIDLSPRMPGVAEIKLETEPLIAHDHEMGMGW